ncbi:ABC transporter permease [Pistricoccus aurantiacus]|uniref:ABC transporter permease n=1 Tax=Pistricoccus aurantiacus TaxID=1883414 RepID=A0A5B8SUA7_9GAMM|nr:ABC transporter permease [Pistricoccus aurantiacus]
MILPTIIESLKGPRSVSRNSVLLVLMPILVLALLGLDLLSVQPNRIAAGQGYSLIDIVGVGVAMLLALLPISVILLAWKETKGRLWLCLGLVTLMLLAMPWGIAWFSSVSIGEDQPYARVGLGSGLWVMLFLLMLMMIELKGRLSLSRFLWAGLWLVILGSTLAAILGGWLDPLSLMQEYRSRSDQFIEALRYHALLVGTAVGISLFVAAGLCLAMRRSQALRGGVFSLLSIIQTIPSLALFGLLLAPLAWLGATYPWLGEMGVQGIGWTPALLALIGYSLLPMTRNAYVALDGVEANLIESARGMGMSPRQIFLQVRLPLALPVMIEGVRITSVQAIGLAAVAALIGAGGLGTFIFQGLGQAAMDMVLLGALPIILMALIVDGLLSALSASLRKGRLNG